jgi:uncharacterized membrane protein
MPFLPEWAPNIHPLIVHFPIAILFAAVFVDLLALVLRWRGNRGHFATYLFAFGAIAAFITYLTGKNAGDSVNIPALANHTLNEHSDLALWTVLFFGIYALVRLILLLRNVQLGAKLSLPLFLIGAGGLYLLFETAEHGAELVFKYGVGVQAAQITDTTESAEDPEESVPVKGIEYSENGSWQWEPGGGVEQVLAQQFRWLEGSAVGLDVAVSSDSILGTVLTLKSQNQPILVVAGGQLPGVQADLMLNIDNFAGTVMLVHHVQDALNYDFVSLKLGSMELGRISDGGVKVMDKGDIDVSGWVSLRAVGEGMHFRGYVNEKLVAHGHGDELPPGSVGIAVQGTGTLLLDKIRVQSLR